MKFYIQNLSKIFYGAKYVVKCYPKHNKLNSGPESPICSFKNFLSFLPQIQYSQLPYHSLPTRLLGLIKSHAFPSSRRPYKVPGLLDHPSEPGVCACLVAPSCSTLCDPMNCIALQIPLSMEFFRQSFSKGVSQPRD